MSEITVKVPGKNARRIPLARVDNRRRKRLARRLAAMGWCCWSIRKATLFTQKAVLAAIAVREDAGIWADVAGKLRAEMARVA